MANESIIREFAHEKQITEANCLGNSLLSGLFAEKITENKKNIKISAHLKNLHELVNKYRIEADKLRSLRIGSCNDILDIKEDKSFDVQITAAEKLLKKIQSILLEHVKHDVSRVVSLQDIQTLNAKMSLLNEIQERLKQAPDSKKDDLKQHLMIVDEIQEKLEKITKSIKEISILVNDAQQDVVTMSSNALYLSNT